MGIKEREVGGKGRKEFRCTITSGSRNFSYQRKERRQAEKQALREALRQICWRHKIDFECLSSEALKEMFPKTRTGTRWNRGPPPMQTSILGEPPEQLSILGPGPDSTLGTYQGTPYPDLRNLPTCGTYQGTGPTGYTRYESKMRTWKMKDEEETVRKNNVCNRNDDDDDDDVWRGGEVTSNPRIDDDI